MKGYNPVVFPLLIYPVLIFERNVEIRANLNNMRLKVARAEWRVRFQNQTALDIIFKFGCVKSFCLYDVDNCSRKTIDFSGLD